MNFPRYSCLYSRFHGCTSFRTEDFTVILDFADEPFTNWSLLHLYRFDRLTTDAKHTFAEALKVFFKTEDPLTVACEHDSWTAVLGNSKIIMPSLEDAATFQLYATPYFVSDPSLVAAYLQGMARAANDYIFMYKNCVLYLDKNDLPSPGGCYFEPSQNGSQYRICLLSNEPMQQVLSVASEWKTRRDVMTLPFLTQETIALPKMIPFQPIGFPYLPDERAISAGVIQKRLSMRHPCCLIQDILASYYRSYLLAHEGQESETVLQNVGLIIEWPFRLMFDGTRPNAKDDKRFVALAVNGQLPTRVLYVRYPYDVYTLYNEVPSTHWTPIQYVSPVLTLEMEKVSVDGVVIGFMYQNSFFCFSFPVLESRPTYDSNRNVQSVLTPANPSVLKECSVLETFQYNTQYSLHRVQMKGVSLNAWCLTAAQNQSEYPTQRHLPKLVQQWLNFFENHAGSMKMDLVDVSMIQMALTLARHKICFETKIDSKAKRKQKGNRIMLSDNNITLSMGPEEAEVVNNLRLGNSIESKHSEGSCSIS
ncbi:uncharacterized protein TNCT_211461 [Trichonephila clavata]|uniref:Uncharacterized protein n=2 Tax=Trichonephila clavata TaxID=2740835 RepID=A0A8X6GPV2_TRICU|nr:uncharacterized protein TNCT_114051 [Trichonephila clavata]GFQ84525.1 uncharacterized protein TNCT_311281 [Trichonephila clavata]GFR08702.1 uncharacterized protein TNCT_242911 [Trichonephila clavata]GFR12587.1 uncharacterized protein TNCT_732471 [Trichonephila clavata]GFR16632.1 uncharacterized protein TNCT_246691 [Trichonephila clavata]